MYRIVFVLFILILVFPVQAQAQDLSFHEVYQAVHGGVILLSSPGGTCSGWRYGNVIITNFHCVRRGGPYQVWHESIGVVDPYGKTVEDKPKPTGKPGDMWYHWHQEPPEPEGLPATVIGTDSEQDLAILMVQDLPDDIISLRIADPSTTKVGDLAFLMGWPLGLWPTFNAGIVSAIDVPFTKFFPQKDNEGMFVADLWVNGGNSGGPVLNINGEVTGMACMSLVLNRGITPTGINLMVNIKHVKHLLATVIAWGKYSGHFVIVPPVWDIVEEPTIDLPGRGRSDGTPY